MTGDVPPLAAFSTKARTTSTEVVEPLDRCRPTLSAHTPRGRLSRAQCRVGLGEHVAEADPPVVHPLMEAECDRLRSRITALGLPLPGSLCHGLPVSMTTAGWRRFRLPASATFRAALL